MNVSQIYAAQSVTALSGSGCDNSINSVVSNLEIVPTE